MTISISKLRARLYRHAKLLGDVQAVRKGRYVKRTQQRIAGKWARRMLNKLIGR